ncbi:MAG TPA: phospholipase D-like domain-containing protein [bacterium]|nr:phospholipase D-like domain-containing protein [bacterium]
MITTSPETSRTDIEAVLRSAKVSVDLAMQSMSDPGIHQILADLAKQGIKIRMVLGGAGRIPENAVLARALESAGMEVGISDKPYIHAKVLIVDGLTVYLGSVNFTTPGFDENREVGILFENREIAQRIS